MANQTLMYFFTLYINVYLSKEKILFPAAMCQQGIYIVKCLKQNAYLVVITTISTFCSHTILQKSPYVRSSGPKGRYKHNEMNPGADITLRSYKAWLGH